MTTIATILLDGERPSRQTLLEYWERSDLTVCADGAATVCLEYGLTPDVVIGDMDSLDDETRRRLTDSRMIQMDDQETTDGEKAIQFCLDRGMQQLWVFGALGKRLDHTIYNLGLLRKFDGYLDGIRMVADEELAFLMSGKRTVSAFPGARISLMPVFGRVSAVRAEGLLYPIENKDLALGKFSSVSNAFTGKTATITVRSGFLLVVQERVRQD